MNVVTTILLPENMAAIFVALIGAAVVTWFIGLKAEGVKRKHLITLFLLALSLRVLLALSLHLVPLIREVDAKRYAMHGWEIVQWWRGTWPGSTPPMNYSYDPAYYYFNALIYLVVGYSPLTVKIFNCFFGALTAVFVYLIGKDIFSKQVALLASTLVAFFPSLVLWSTQNLREASIIFLTSLVIWAVLRLHREFGWTYVAVTLAALGLLAALRWPVFDLLVLSIALSSIIRIRDFKSKKILLGILGGLFVILLVDTLFLHEHVGLSPLKFLSGGTGLSDGSMPFPQSVLYSLDSYLRQVLGGLDSSRKIGGYGSSALPTPDLSSPKIFLLFLPEALMHSLLRPFPWEEIASRNQMFTIPEMLIWYSLIPFTLLGLAYSVRVKGSDIALILIFVSLLTVMNAMAIGNLGAAYRHRAQVWVYFLLLASVGIDRVVRTKWGKQLLLQGKEEIRRRLVF